MKAPARFPSSKLCHDCGWKNDALTLADREWVCGGCGVIQDRDANAALNLRDYESRALPGDSLWSQCKTPVVQAVGNEAGTQPDDLDGFIQIGSGSR